MKTLFCLLLAFAAISSTCAQGSILLQPPSYSEVSQGQTVRFTCVGYSTGGVSPPTISWQGPDGTSLTATEGVSIYAEVQTADSTPFRVSVLELCDVDVSQTGTYSCAASGGVGSIGSNSAFFDILVLGEAKVAASIVVHPPEAQEVSYLDNVELVCMAYGVPLPTITWSIPECNDITWSCNYTSTINVTDSVINYGGVQFRKSVLQFCSVQKLDTNVYTCWTENGIPGPGIAISNRSTELKVTIPTPEPSTELFTSMPTTMTITPSVSMSTAPPTTTTPYSSRTNTRTSSSDNSLSTNEPTARASTGTQTTTYQIILAIEAAVIAALLVSVFFTTVVLCITSPKSKKGQSDSFAYKTWSPDATDKDPGLGAQNPLADDPGNETLDDDFSSPDIGALIEEVGDDDETVNPPED